jgi:hypothetical protein
MQRFYWRKTLGKTLDTDPNSGEWRLKPGGGDSRSLEAYRVITLVKATANFRTRVSIFDNTGCRLRCSVFFQNMVGTPLLVSLLLILRRPRGEMPKCNKVRRPPLNADRPVSSVKIRTWIRGLGFGDLGLSPSL